MCLQGALCSIPFNLKYIMATFSGKCFDLFTHPRGQECVQEQNVCVHGALCSIPINSICNMTTCRKKF